MVAAAKNKAGQAAFEAALKAVLEQTAPDGKYLKPADWDRARTFIRDRTVRGLRKRLVLHHNVTELAKDGGFRKIDWQKLMDWLTTNLPKILAMISSILVMFG